MAERSKSQAYASSETPSIHHVSSGLLFTIVAFVSAQAPIASAGVPASLPFKRLVIGALLPEQATISGGLEALGFLSAIQDVNNSTLVLPHYELEPMIRDSAGDTWLGMQEAASIIGDGHAVAVVGPVLTAVARVVSPIASRCGVPFVTPSSTSLSLSFHEVHNYILQLSPSSRVLSQALIDVIQEFEWNYVAIIKSDGEHGEAALYVMEQLARQQGLQIIRTVSVPVYPGSETVENHTTIIETLKRKMKPLATLHARIFVLSVLDHQLELVLQAANDLGLVGDEYVWIIDSIESPEELLRPKLLKLLQGSLGLSISLPRSAMEWEQKHNCSFTTIQQLYSYDAVWLIAHALHQFLQDGYSLDRIALPRAEGSPQLYKQINGHLLLEYMQNVSFEGISGTVDFDGETGERLKTYNVVNMFNASFCNIGKWSLTGNSRKKRIDMGGQYPSPKWYSGSDVIPADRDTSTTQHITALAIVNDPYLYRSNNNNSGKAVAGYLIDMMDELRRNIGFSYSLKFWNHSYDDAVRYISQANHPYTLLVADVTITAYRSGFVDFSHSYLTVHMSLLVKRPDSGTAAGIWGFLAPFDYKVWLLIFSFFVFGAVILRITELYRDDHPNLTFGESLWISFSCVFGTHKDDKVTSLFGRAWLIVMLLTLLVLLSVYTATLTGFLLSKELKLDVAKPEDLLEEPVGAISGTASFSYLRDVEGLKNLVPLTVAEASLAIANNTVKAFIADRPVIQHLARKDCSVYVTEIQFHPKQLALAFQRGSALLGPINDKIQSFWESGYLNRLYDRHFVWFSKCVRPEETHDLYTIDIEEIKGIFIALAITTVVCLTGHLVIKRLFLSVADVCAGDGPNQRHQYLLQSKEGKRKEAPKNDFLDGLYIETKDSDSD